MRKLNERGNSYVLAKKPLKKTLKIKTDFYKLTNNGPIFQKDIFELRYLRFVEGKISSNTMVIIFIKLENTFGNASVVLMLLVI